jgi:isopentenyl-diphosphate delta-isomerase
VEQARVFQPPTGATQARKERHLDVCLDEDVQSSLDPAWSAVRLRHEALPEIALADVDTGARFLHFRLRAPILISSMTGGTPRAAELNRRLAASAERAGLAIGLGSGRALIENPEVLPTFDVRPVAPHAVIFANIGAVSLNYGIGIDDVRRMIVDLQADGLFLHLNPLQEALQPDGDTDFRGLLAKIGALCRALEVPVVAKGVGSGISPATAARLLDAGVAGIDAAAAGGTSWARVEGKRSGDERREALAETFAGWGFPAAEAVRALRERLPSTPLIASGGVRSGVDIAKAIALGADLCGLALPFLTAANASSDAVDDLIADLIAGLRIAMFATGSTRLAGLRRALL